MRVSRHKILIAGVLLATLPLPAYCFPFILAGGGASALPFVMALLSIINKNRTLVIAITLASLVGYQLWTPSFSELSSVQDKDDNRLAYMMSNERLIQSKILGSSTEALKISYSDALASKAPLLYVNSGGSQNFPGISFVELMANSRYLDPKTILISSNGFMSANAASVTGLRYVPDTINDILNQFANIPTPKIKQVPTCEKGECVSVALLDGYFFLYSGYPYKRFDETITIQSLLLSDMGGIKRLKELTNNGKKPLYIEYFGSDESEKMMTGVANLLTLAGITYKKMGIYEEVDKTPDNFGLLAKNFFQTRIVLNFSDISFLCKDDTQVVMTTNNKNESDILLPNYVLNRCQIHTFPIEGLSAHDAMRYVAEHADELDRSKRLVGIYSDKASAFYSGIAMDVLKHHRFYVIGKSAISVDAEPSYGLNNLYGINHLFDAMTLKLFQNTIGMDHELSYSAFSTITAIISGLIFLCFMATGRTWLSQLVWVINLTFLAYSQFVYFYFPVEHRTDPMAMIIAIIAAQLVVAGAWSKLKKPTSFSKYRGLLWLKKNGFQTADAIIVRDLNPAVLQRISSRIGLPMILRSNEMTHENQSRSSSGQYESIVLNDVRITDALSEAWATMLQQGGKPSFIAQPFLRFDQSGVVEAKHDQNGRIVFIIESSSTPEGVTGNAAASITTHQLDMDACFFSEHKLHQDLYRMFKKLKGCFVAEFGITNGNVIWTQILRTPMNSAYFDNPSEESLYTVSAFNSEISKPSTLLVSFLNRFMTGLDYRLCDGVIVDRKTAPFGLIRAASLLIPATTIHTVIRITYRTLRMTPTHVLQGWPLNAYIRWALLLNLVCKLKTQRDRMVTYKIHAQDWLHAQNIESPYNILEIDQQISPALAEGEDNHLMTFRGREMFACAEYCRITLSLLATKWSKGIHQAAKAQGISAEALPHLNVQHLELPLLKEMSQNIFMPDAEEGHVICRGIKTCSGPTIHLQSYASLLPAEASNITLVVPTAWLALLNHADQIAKIIIESGAHRNSHFVQRCIALGITVEKPKVQQ